MYYNANQNGMNRLYQEYLGYIQMLRKWWKSVVGYIRALRYVATISVTYIKGQKKTCKKAEKSTCITSVKIADRLVQVHHKS